MSLRIRLFLLLGGLVALLAAAQWWWIRGLTGELYDELDAVAIVQGVGYPGPKRSHFKAMDVWHAGDLRGRLVSEGWVGRLCQCAFGKQREPGRVVHIGEALPYSLHSARHPATAFANPDGFRWVGNEDKVSEVDQRLTKRLKKRKVETQYVILEGGEHWRSDEKHELIKMRSIIDFVDRYIGRGSDGPDRTAANAN